MSPRAAGLDLRRVIRGIPDFPKPGIMFRDITPLLADPTTGIWVDRIDPA